MRTSHLLSLVAPVLTLTIAWNPPQALAQESLAGVGAASGIGATLGAAATTNISPSRVTSGVNGSPNFPSEGGEGAPGSGVAGGGAASNSSAGTPVTRTLPPLAGRSGNGQALLGQILAIPLQPIPENVRRSSKAQANYSRRVSRLSPAARKKLVMKKYKIAPRGYLSYYLAADRYKLGKTWKYVSTETDNYYYRPQDMPQRGFNPNRVIGFSSWQDAMRAGYKPDPASKPEPGPQLYQLGRVAPRTALYRYVEYVYAGQVADSDVKQTASYVTSVYKAVNSNPAAKWQSKAKAGDALDYILGVPNVDQPLLAGSPAFEKDFKERKDAIRNAVIAENEAKVARAIPKAENILYRPGSLIRALYDFDKYERLNLGTFSFSSEVLNTAAAVVRGSMGGFRNADSEIASFASQVIDAAKKPGSPSRATSTTRLRNRNSSLRLVKVPRTGTPKVKSGYWLNHYLPADRQRIQSGLWKVVSTDLDTYFHTPNSREMIIQSADRVIGFPSFAAAVEAGYTPSPTSNFDLRQLKISINKSRVGSEAAVNEAIKRATQGQKAAEGTTPAAGAAAPGTNAPRTASPGMTEQASPTGTTARP